MISSIGLMVIYIKTIKYFAGIYLISARETYLL